MDRAAYNAFIAAAIWTVGAVLLSELIGHPLAAFIELYGIVAMIVIVTYECLKRAK